MTDRWATFDCYGTLIDWNAGVRGVLRRVWPDQDPERLLALHHAVERLVQGADRKLPYRQVGARTLRAIAAITGLPLAASDEFLLAETLPDWPAFPEVPAALATLQQHGWRLAILSNTDPDLLDASIQQIGVPVDVRITAAEAGSYKPAHGHWNQFFARTNADRAHHVHVAASLFHDIAPAQELGLTAAWINRLGERSDLPRAAELGDLHALPETLDRLVSHAGGVA